MTPLLQSVSLLIASVPGFLLGRDAEAQEFGEWIAKKNIRNPSRAVIGCGIRLFFSSAAASMARRERYTEKDIENSGRIASSFCRWKLFSPLPMPLPLSAVLFITAFLLLTVPFVSLVLVNFFTFT